MRFFFLSRTSGEYKKDELLEGSRSGNEEKLMSLLTPLNVNCHASDGRKSTPLHLAAGYNRTRIVQLLLQHGADVHAKDKGGLVPLHNACSYGHFEVSLHFVISKQHIQILTSSRIIYSLFFIF